MKCPERRGRLGEVLMWCHRQRLKLHFADFGRGLILVRHPPNNGHVNGAAKPTLLTLNGPRSLAG